MTFDSFVTYARQHPATLSTERCQELAAGQKPQALFIGCSDSRVIPSRITGAEPGMLFELRTAGNIVPEYAPQSGSSEMGTIEYAVLQLGVPDIIVCGHSHCGAVTALTLAGRGLDELPALRTWLGTDGCAAADIELADPSVRTESKQHAYAQLRTLREYPFVRDRVESGQLRLHGWFYEIDTGLVYRCSPESDEFTPL